MIESRTVTPPERTMRVDELSPQIVKYIQEVLASAIARSITSSVIKEVNQST